MLDRVKAYFDSKDVNVSLLKELQNPKWIKIKRMNPDMEDPEKRHHRIGSAIDCMLTEPDKFKERFIKMPDKRPGGMMATFVEALPKTSPTEEDLLKAYEIAGFKLKVETIVQKFYEDKVAQNYHSALIKSEGKTILSSDEWEEVQHCKQYLLGNPYTRKFFMNTNPNLKVHYQVPIYFPYRGKRCKALLDGIILDKENKIAYPWDLKTTAFSIAENNFKLRCLKLGYYLQASHYCNGIQLIIDTPEDCIIPDELKILNKEWRVNPLKFVVTEKNPTHSNPARIFTCSEDDIKKGMIGGYDKQGIYYPGVDELIDTLTWHEEKDYWDLPKELVDSEGEIPLNLFN